MADPDVTTKLTIERTRVAYDRTMMAWIRTGTSLISFGFAVYKFFQLDLRVVERSHQLIGPHEFALLMVGSGLVSLVLGTIEYRSNMQSLIRLWPECPRSRVALISWLISGMGVLTLLVVFFRG